MISYLKLQNDKEIIVMQSAGISPFKISKPALLVALVSSIILFIISHFILPKTYTNFKELQDNIRNSEQKIILRDNVFININKYQTIFIGKVTKNNVLEEVFIQDKTDSLNLVEYFSKNGYVNIDRTINLRLIKGTRVSTDKKGRSTILNFDNYNIKVQKAEDKFVSDRVVEYNEYSFFELIKKADERLANQGKLLAEAHTRNTVIFMPIVFTLIAMLIIVNDNYSRLMTTYKKTFAIGLIFIFQSLVIILKNAVHNDISLLPLIYLFPTSILILCFILLNKKINPFKSLSF